MLQGTRSGREFDIIIVDEYGKKTLLAGQKPYMSKLNYILIAIWIQFEIETKGITNKEIVRNNRELLQEQLENVGRNILYGDEENNFKIPLPKYLIEYSEFEIKEWAKNEVEAYLMEENEKYSIYNGVDRKKIVPIDNENTGV